MGFGLSPFTFSHLDDVLLFPSFFLKSAPMGILLLLPGTSWLAGVLCALNVLFLFGLGLFLFGQVTVSKAGYLLVCRPCSQRCLRWRSSRRVLTVGIVVGTILAWRGYSWLAGRRIHYTLVTLAALAFAWELLYWNLLGFRA